MEVNVKYALHDYERCFELTDFAILPSLNHVEVPDIEGAVLNVEIGVSME